MKTVLIFTLLGALAGIAAASFVVPAALGWYNEAGYLSQTANGQSQPQALVNIPQLIHYTTSRLIRGQAIGGGIGAAVFLVLGVFVTRRGQRPGSDAAAGRASASAGAAR
jgi:hypothetical protein